MILMAYESHNETIESMAIKIWYLETVNDFDNFESYGETGGCSAVFMGKMMHFGGANRKHYSIIKDCKMDVQWPDMPFEFYDGACNSFLKPSPKVLLCFSSATTDAGECHT